MVAISRALLAALAVLAIAIAAPVAGAHGSVAPGAPGAKAWWTPADKDGFGTAASLDSKLWHTLEQGELTEVYYPDLGTPSIRDLQLVVSDGRTFADRERDATTHRVELVDRRSLTYRQIDTAKSGAYRIVKPGEPGFPPGEGTLSATPLAWSHAQFVRLAWSIEAGHPVEQPTIVACRYVRSC